MTDIDSTLARLRDLPVDPRLNSIDATVIDGVNRQLSSGERPSGGLFATVAIVALVTGIAGAAIPAAPASTAQNPFPLGAPASLAPSTLLTSAR